MDWPVWIASVAIIYLIRLAVSKLRNKSKGGAQTITKCPRCNWVLHTVSERKPYGFYGCPFRFCSQCGTEYFDRYYHEIALIRDSQVNSSYLFEAGSFSKEMEASHSRLAKAGYPAQLYEKICSADEQAASQLKADIRSQMKKYTDLLMENGVAPLPEFRLKNAAERMERLTYEAHDASAVRQVVSDVLIHFGIKPEYYQVEVEYSNQSSMEPGTMLGSFTRGQMTGGKIHVKVQSRYSYYDTIVSVVLHECAHAFLALKGISFKEKDENERLTDAAAIYLGGGNYVLRGYYPSNEYRIGYLRKAESEEIKSLSNQCAASVREKQKTEKEKARTALEDKQKRLQLLADSVKHGRQTIDFTKIIRETSIQNHFYQTWQETDECLAETDILIKKLRDGSGKMAEAMRETMEQASRLEKCLQAYENELNEWKKAEAWQQLLPSSVLDNVRGVEELVKNGNAFAMLERIRFWAACSETKKDARIYFEKLAGSQTADALCAAGICHMQGLGTEKNERAARECFIRSADMGSKDALKMLKEHTFS